MSDAFIEQKTITFRDEVTFVTGFGIVADQPFQVGSSSTTNSKLITYNLIEPIGGISGYLRSGEGGGTTTNNYYVNSGSGLFVFQTDIQSGVSEQFINFPTILDSNPTVIYSIRNNDFNTILGSQISGTFNTGYRLIFTDNVPHTGYKVFTFAANSTGTGLATTAIINNVNNIINKAITGSGTLNYIPKFTNQSGIINSNINQDGSTVNIAGDILVTDTQPDITLNNSSAAQFSRVIFTDTGVNFAAIQGIGSTFGTANRRLNMEFYNNNMGNDITFTTNNIERIRILKAGNVGIATVSPISTLDVSGHIYALGGKVLTAQDSGNINIRIENTGTALQNQLNVLTNTTGLFVDRINDQIITGNKTFFNTAYFNGIDDTLSIFAPQIGFDANTYIDIQNSNLRGGAGGELRMNWTNGVLYDGATNVTLNWTDRQLTGGIWHAEGLRISGQAVIPGAGSSTNIVGLISTGDADNRYINRTSEQSVTGIKRFVDQVFVSGQPVEYYKPTLNYTGTNTVNNIIINWASGNFFKFTLTGNSNIYHTGFRDGQSITVSLGNTGNNFYSGFWFPYIHWPYTNVPAQSSGNKQDVYTFIRCGTGILANVVQGFDNYNF